MRLRPVDPAADLAPLLALFRRPEVRRYLFDDRICDEPLARELIAGTPPNGAAGFWVAALDGAPTQGFFRLAPEGDAPDCVDLLYGLAPEIHGQGWAWRCAARLVDRAFGYPEIARVTANADLPNVASIRVLERLGFGYVETRALPNGPTVFYEMPRARWTMAPFADAVRRVAIVD